MDLVNGWPRAGAVVCACAFIAGCGDVLSTIGSGSGSDNTTTLTDTTALDTGSVSGVAMSGLLTGSDVRVFSFDGGTKGDMLAAGQTDAQGRYRVNLTVRSQPILVEVSGGRYIEPASSRTVTLSDGQVLLAVQNYLNGSTVSISPTYYTTLAAGLAESLVRRGATPPQAVVDANQRIPAIAGLAAGFDAVAATPTDISSPASLTPFVSTEVEYGFVTAAPSSLTEAASITANRPVHETINAIGFTQLALDDVRQDGVLDGQGARGALAIGVTPLSADVYRNALAINILRIAGNTQGNQTSISPAQMLPLAQRLNNSTDPIYGERPIIPLNADAPVIADISIAPNAILAGNVTFTATVTSVLGINAVEVLIDNRVVGTAADPARPSIDFDTTILTDGNHQLSVRATDLVGGTTTTPAVTFTISNADDTGSVSGVAMSGLLTGSDVRVFSFDSGTKGDMLAAGQTDAQGRYRVNLTVRSQPILVEVSGGRYIEPASSRTVTLGDGQVLLAVQSYLNGSTVSISPTYYTTLAAGLAESLVRRGATPPQAVVDANQRIPAIAGLVVGFDAVAATPVDISNPASLTPFVSTELEYGFVTAAPSSLTEAASVTANRPIHETINSIAFTQLALDDVRQDGVLDGQGARGALAIGVTPLSADVYRNTLAINVLRIASNTQGNQTSITPTQMLPFALRLNKSTDPIYGDRPVIPLNTDVPLIADVSIGPNALLAGDITLTATATSVVGVSAVELLIDNVVVGTAMDPARPSIPFDTTTLTDGSHQLSVRATDFIGGQTTTDAVIITISNAEGRIGNISLANNAVIRGTVAVSADIADGAGIAQVRYFVDDLLPAVSTDPGTPFQLDTVTLELNDDRAHTFRIAATNNLGREITSPIINFRVDNTAPVILIDGAQSENGVCTISGVITDASGISQTSLIRQGATVPLTIRSGGSFTLETSSPVTIVATDSPGNTSSLNLPVQFGPEGIEGSLAGIASCLAQLFVQSR